MATATKKRPVAKKRDGSERRPKKRYQWVKGFRNVGKCDAQEVGEELAEICRENDSSLWPEATVRKARSRRSNMRGHFDWNDESAAHEHRLTQARQLILPSGAPKPLPARQTVWAYNRTSTVGNAGPYPYYYYNPAFAYTSK